MAPTPPVALSIAGLDATAGAGLGSDWKTFAAHGVYGLGVATAITCQDTRGVHAVEGIAPARIEQQLRVLCADVMPAAVKVGMLAGRPQALAVAQFLANLPAPIVCDPVLASQSGDELLDEAGRGALRELLPHVSLLTPNLDEAAALLAVPRARIEADPRAACEALCALGASAVVLTGGHGHDPAFSEDGLWDGSAWHTFRVRRIDTRNDHGTGCTFSAAVCARLARGESLEAAVRGAQGFVQAALEGARGWRLGGGRGPLHHFAQTDLFRYPGERASSPR